MRGQVSAARAVDTAATAPRARDSFGIGGVPVRIEAAPSALAKRVMDWLARAFPIAREARSPRAPIRLRVVAGESKEGPPARARELAASAAWRVLRDDRRVFLLFPQARCTLDLAAGRADLLLAEGWWREPLKLQQDPWLLTLAWLLRERGRYTLHASAAVRGDQGLLIAGDSGSGKSSTALSLIHTGWDWLADDMVLLEPGVPPRLHALARGFAFHPTLAERLPDLAGEAVAEKRFADVETLFRGRQVAACGAAALLFPRVADADRSRLEPLSPAEALIALLPASGGILVGGTPGRSRAHLMVLRDLVAGAPAYRLHAGRDIFGDGAALEALLAAHGVAPCG